jgi:hypothetical protein
VPKRPAKIENAEYSDPDNTFRVGQPAPDDIYVETPIGGEEKVVTSVPERGYVLVAKGDTVSAAMKQRYDVLTGKASPEDQVRGPVNIPPRGTP